MLRWLHRFFYSDDPEVKVAAALSEPEAKMWQEMLANKQIPSAVKNITGGIWGQYGTPSSLAIDYDLFVKESDLAQARDLLAPLLKDGSAET